MELELKEQTVPGFTAEASLEGSIGHYAGAANQTDSPDGVVPAAFCWDPYRFKWVLC
jgi:hypothetical protein